MRAFFSAWRIWPRTVSDGPGSVHPAGPPMTALFAVDTPAARRCADAISVEADLSFAVEALAILVEHHNTGTEGTVAARALWVAAVTSYGRAFGSGVRGGYRLASDRIAALDGGAAVYHQWLRDMRDKNVAHSVNAFEQVVVGVILGLPENHSSGILGTGHLAMAHTGLLKADALQTLRFAREVRDLVRQDLPELEKAMLESAQAIPIEDLYAKSPANIVAPGPGEAGRRRRPAAPHRGSRA
jgi:hypothetical protein